MKKYVLLAFIAVFALWSLPSVLFAADDVSFTADTDIEVGGFTLKVMSGSLVDQIEVGASTVTFTFSANSSLDLRSYSRINLSNDLGLSITCIDDYYNSYSKITVSGNSVGSTLIITPSGTCALPATGAPSGGSVAELVQEEEPTTPTATGEGLITSSDGGQVTATTDENTIAKIEVPAEAVSESTNIVITPESKSAVIISRPVPSKKSVVGGYIYNYVATVNEQAVTNFNKEVTLTLTYTDAQISGFNESSLKIYYWDEVTLQWIALTTIYDLASNTLTATTDHFTYFAIFGDIVEGETISLQDGDLIRNPNAEGMAQFDIYIVKLVGDKKFKRLVLSPHVFESYEHFDKNGDGNNWDDVDNVNQVTMDLLTISDLVRKDIDPLERVYSLSVEDGADAGIKQWLNMSTEAFLAANYDPDSIYTVNSADIAVYETKEDIVE